MASLPPAIPGGLGVGAGAVSGKALLDRIVHLPLVLPPVVTGYLLLLSFGRRYDREPSSPSISGLVFSFRWTGAAALRREG